MKPSAVMLLLCVIRAGFLRRASVLSSTLQPRISQPLASAQASLVRVVAIKRHGGPVSELSLEFGLPLQYGPHSSLGVLICYLGMLRSFSDGHCERSKGSPPLEHDALHLYAVSNLR
jgi:hypothetical protein